MTLKLGQVASKTDEGVWAYIMDHRGSYVLWTEEQDDTYRQALKVPADRTVAQVKVRRFGNPDASAYRRQAAKRYRKIGNVPDEIQDKIARDTVAHAILEDWRNIAPPGSEAVAYTPEIGARAFSDDPDFYEAITAFSIDEENFRTEAIAEDAKALGNGSDGTSGGAPNSAS